jgi:hypothetical protein
LPVTTLAKKPVAPETNQRFVWNYIRNPGYDWTFFLAPFWVSAVYWLAISILPAYDMTIYLVSYIVLAETHFASTWMIFLDPQNREYYSASKWVYYYVPALIIAGCMALSYFVSLKLTLFLAAILSAIHVTRQSTGIVALYRGRSGDNDPLRRTCDNYAIYFASTAFLAVGFMRFYLNDKMLPFGVNSLWGQLITWGSQAALVISVIAAAWFIGQAFLMERQRYLQGNTISLSRNLVFAYSLLLYSPYLFATRMEHAIAMGVGIHYVQYLGIVWWLNRNKYPLTNDKSAGTGRRILGMLSQQMWVRMPYLLGYGLLMFALRQDGLNDWTSLSPQSWLYSIPIALQVCHYHLDAYVWKFSNPFIRNTVLKYLKG